METYATQVMELLSLGQGPSGRYELKVEVIRHDRQDRRVIEIDEFTFRQIDAVHPLEGGRVRLSPYTKWDPYRGTHYGMLVRMNGASRETLYFACSDDYGARLERLIEQREEPSFMPLAAGAPTLAAAGPIPAGPSPLWRLFSARAVRTAVQPVAIVGGLLLFLGLQADNRWFTDHVDALSRQPVEADAGGAVGAGKAVGDSDWLQSGSYASVDGAPLLAPEELPAQRDGATEAGIANAAPAADTTATADPAGYEVVEIGDEKSYFGLPKGRVALTFDDGPSTYTKKIVDLLHEEGVAATFLFVGNNVERFPDAVEYASGHGMSIGNHSWDHSVLTKATPAEQVENIKKATSALEELTKSPVTLFRPPYGSTDASLAASAKEQKLKVLLWNRDPEDWNAKTSADIVRYFREVEASGGVYVLHEDKLTVEALPDIIRYLKEKELTFAIFK